MNISLIPNITNVIVSNITIHTSMSLIDSESTATDSNGLFASEQDPGYDEDESFLTQLIKARWSNNFTGLVILCLVLLILAIIFFGCYLIMRFMHRALSGDETKEAFGVGQMTDMVIHPKRVYEIQAEEGCFSGPPDPYDSSTDSDNSYESDKKMNCEGEEESISPRSSMRQPERGDLKCMRTEGGYHDDDPQAIIRKKQKVHKDSVCALLFRPQNVPRPV